MKGGLQNARDALQDVVGILAAASRRAGEGHARRGGTAPRPVIPGERPEVSGSSPWRLNHWRTMARSCPLLGREPGPAFRLLPGRRLQGKRPRGHEQLAGPLQIGNQRPPHRLQLIGRLADPGCQRRTIQVQTLAAVNLRLPVQRQMAGVFADPLPGRRTERTTDDRRYDGPAGAC